MSFIVSGHPNIKLDDIPGSVMNIYNSLYQLREELNVKLKIMEDLNVDELFTNTIHIKDPDSNNDSPDNYTYLSFAEALLYYLPIYIQDDEPTDAEDKALWIETDNYSRYDLQSITADTVDTISSGELIIANPAAASITITLPSATSNPGVTRHIHNKSDYVVILSGSINGGASMNLFPDESVELISSSSEWHIM